MNNDWLDIAILEDYLDGKLDPKSMNRVERASLEDPFVAEALAGLSMSPKRSLASLSLLQKQLHERIAEQQHVKKSAVITWQRLSIAATAAVLFISVGVIFWMKQVSYQENLAKLPKKVDVSIAPKVDDVEQTKVAAKTTGETISSDIAMSAQVKAVSRPKVSAAPATAVLSRKKFINGAVTDETSGEPVVGANIYVMDGAGRPKVMGRTDGTGKFNISADSLGKDQEILVSSISYKTKKLTAKPDELLAISLTEEKSQMNEVVIRGYQKRTREATTGSSFIVSGKEVKDTPVANVESLLQGKVAGLNIQNSTGSPINASPVGGWLKFREYLIKGNKYSSEAKAGQSLEYKFTVKDGKPDKITIVKGLSRRFDREAVRLIKEGPDWKLVDLADPEVTVVLEY